MLWSDDSVPQLPRLLNLPVTRAPQKCEFEERRMTLLLLQEKGLNILQLCGMHFSPGAVQSSLKPYESADNSMKQNSIENVTFQTFTKNLPLKIT